MLAFAILDGLERLDLVFSPVEVPHDLVAGEIAELEKLDQDLLSMEGQRRRLERRVQDGAEGAELVTCQVAIEEVKGVMVELYKKWKKCQDNVKKFLQSHQPLTSSMATEDLLEMVDGRVAKHLGTTWRFMGMNHPGYRNTMRRYQSSIAASLTTYFASLEGDDVPMWTTDQQLVIEQIGIRVQLALLPEKPFTMLLPFPTWYVLTKMASLLEKTPQSWAEVRTKYIVLTCVL